MHKAILILAGLAWLAAAGRAPALFAGGPAGDAFPRAWLSLEYLNLWAAPAPMSVPLVSTGDSIGLGRLDSPNTTVLFGDRPMNAGAFPGFRATLGGWFSPEGRFGAEFSGFATGLRAAHFNVASNAQVSPLLAIPFSDASGGTPGESSLVISQPGLRFGRISADDASIFGGLEADGLYKIGGLAPRGDCQLAAIGGLRLVTLWEQFTIDSITADTNGLVQTRDDTFAALNRFFGAEFGLRASRRFRRLTLEMSGKTAFGTTWQAQSAAGHSVLPFTATPAGSGFFTQPTNAAFVAPQAAFSVVPAARLRLGYDLTRRLRATISYEGLLWTNVIRPSNQLDREINLSQLSGPLVGAARPAPQHRQSDFWAQGFTAGLQFNY